MAVVLNTEQPDFSLDVQDNGRLCFVVLGLTKSSCDIAKEVCQHLQSLPPFQVPGGIFSLRFLSALPYWSYDKKSKKECILSYGSKRVFGFLGIAHCHDPDDLLDAESNYKNHLERISNHPVTNRCLVFSNQTELERSLKGRETFVFIQLKKDSIIQSCSDKLLEILGHLLTLVHSNLKVTVSNEQLIKKAGSLTGSQSEPNAMINDEQQKHQQARSLKTKADLYLLLGQYNTGAQIYNEAFLLFRQMKEYLWAGSALEGLISTHFLMTAQHGNLLSLTDIFDETQSLDQINAPNQDKSLITDAKSDSSVEQSSGQIGDGEINTVSTDMTDGDGQVITRENVDKNFQITLNFYEKAGLLEKKSQIELSLKYSYYLIQQKNYSKACHVLEEVLGTVIEPPLLQLSLYLALSTLYKLMNFKHKTLFMLVAAARISVELATDSNVTTTDLGDLNMKAYNLLDYCVRQFDDTSNNKVSTGWPLLQATIIRDYTDVCMRLGYTQLFFKWSWLLLQNFHSYLSQEDLTRITDGLKDMVDKTSENNESSLSAPFPLTSIPRVATFKPQSLAPLLTVHKSLTLFSSLLTTSNSSQGPFLLSMIGKNKAKDKRQEVMWVQGDPAEVLLVVSNPLPLELKVEKMTVSMEGAKATSYPSNISLPAKCDPQEFVLLCIPCEPGTISIVGYTAQIFGLNNNSSTNCDSIVKVIPSLPQLRVRVFPCSKDSTPNSAVTSSLVRSKRRSMSTLDYFELLDGEIYQCDLQLQSIGDVPIECIKMSLKEQSSDYCQLSWSENEFMSLFPLSEKNKLYHFTLTLKVTIPHYLRVGSCKVLADKKLLPNSPNSTSFSSFTLPKPPSLPNRDDSNIKYKSATLSNSNNNKESSSSLLSSPSKWSRGGGSLRRSKEEKKATPRSDLLESLDLNHPSNRSKTLQPARIKVSSLNKVSSSPQRSPQRSPSLFRRKPTPGKPIPQQNDRLMDSLNLEHSSSPTHPQATPINKATPTTQDTPSDASFVRLSNANDDDIVDFEGGARDRTSIKSDPGIDILASPPVSPSIKPFLPPTSQGTLGIGPSFLSFKKKRPLGPQASVPIKSFPNVVKPVISHPTDAQKVRRSPQEKLVKTTLLLQYTGGDGAKEGYYRELTLDVTSNIKPTLVFDDFAISPVKGFPDHFSFNMVIENVSPYPLNITIDIDQDDLSTKSYEYFLNSCTNEQIALPMKRFTLSDKDDSIKEANVIKHYCEHIVSLLIIRWKGDNNKSGLLTLKGLQLPQSALSIIRPLPILFDVELDNTVNNNLGIPVLVTVKVTNNTSGILPSSLISLSPFTLSPNGQKIDSIVQQHVLHSQSLHQWIPQLSEDGSHSFTISFIFLYPNEYLVDISHYIMQGGNKQSKDNKSLNKSLINEPAATPVDSTSTVNTSTSTNDAIKQKVSESISKDTSTNDKNTTATLTAKNTPADQKDASSTNNTDNSNNSSTSQLAISNNSSSSSQIKKPFVVISPVLPIMKSTGSSPPTSPHHSNITNSTLDNSGNDKYRPMTFMTKARSYIGPQLTINIK